MTSPGISTLRRTAPQTHTSEFLGFPSTAGRTVQLVSARWTHPSPIVLNRIELHVYHRFIPIFFKNRSRVGSACVIVATALPRFFHDDCARQSSGICFRSFTGINSSKPQRRLPGLRIRLHSALHFGCGSPTPSFSCPSFVAYFDQCTSKFLPWSKSVPNPPPHGPLVICHSWSR